MHILIELFRHVINSLKSLITKCAGTEDVELDEEEVDDLVCIS